MLEADRHSLPIAMMNVLDKWKQSNGGQPGGVPLAPAQS